MIPIRLPKSILPRLTWYVGIVLVILLLTELCFAFAVQGNPNVIASNAILSVVAIILSLLVTIAGPLSLLLGIVSVMKYKEWSVVFFLIVTYIIGIGMFVVSEVLFPH